MLKRVSERRHLFSNKLLFLTILSCCHLSGLRLYILVTEVLSGANLTSINNVQWPFRLHAILCQMLLYEIHAADDEGTLSTGTLWHW